MCKKLLFISFISLLVFFSSVSAAPFGLWEFNAGNLTQATVGSDLTVTGSITAAAGVGPGDGAALVSEGDYLTFTGMGSNTKTWSLLIDFSVPQSTIGQYQGLYQTDPDNDNDAECFIKNNDQTLGSGNSGYTTNSVVADTWYRMVVTFDYATISYNMYINGVNWRNTFAQPGDGHEDRWVLQNIMHLFADNDGEDPGIYVSTAAFWTRELSAAEAASLGMAGAPVDTTATTAMHYGFDSVGATVADSSGNGNNATVLGNITGYQFGRSGADAIFGGTSADYLAVPVIPVAQRATSALTMATWCKLDQTNGRQTIFHGYGPKPSNPADSAHVIQLEIREDIGTYRFVVRNSEGETIGDFNPPAAMVYDKWFHIAYVYDKLATDGLNLKIYIDGEYYAGTAAAALADINVGNNWVTAAIGCTADGHSRNYKGQMDEFYMFNRALTSAEISALASPNWLANGGFETGDITGWTQWDAATKYGTWGEAGTMDVASSKSVEVYPTMFETLDAASGDYSCYLEGGQQYGITQTVFVPAGTLVQVDALWSGTFTVGGEGWAELKALTHAPGASYNMDGSQAGYTGQEIMVAKTDTYGPLNPKADQTWDWEDAPAACPVDDNQFISQGEIVIVTKFGGFPVNSLVGGMAVDDIAVKSLPRIAIAYAPQPGDGSTLSWRDTYNTTLSWTAGYLAASHEVYLGTDETNVANATTASPEYMGSVNTESYIPTLVPETTYYWRVDEVNGIDTWKGDIWSFTCPVAPVIDDPILWYQFNEGSGTTAADSAGGGFDGTMTYADWSEGPDGSNCYANLINAGQKNFVDVPNDVFTSIDEKCTMSIWLWEADPNDGAVAGAVCRTIWRGGSLTDPDRNAIFDNEGILVQGWEPEDTRGWYTVSRMGADHDFNHDPSGWEAADKNYNSQWGFFGRGYYVNPIGKWSHLTVVKDNTDYNGSGSLKIYLNGILNSTNNRANCNKSMAGVDVFKLAGGYDQDDGFRFTGKLDDFRIYDRALSAADVELLVGDHFKKAGGPNPADGADKIALDAMILSWMPGQDAVSHHVYFSDDRIEVKNADTLSSCYIVQQTATTYPLGDLDLGKTYYWRIDEVDSQDDVYKGDVWSFSSIPYIVVEDFESYDLESNSIGAVWTDKYGYTEMDVALNNPEEGGPVLSPVNSMKLLYHIPFDPYYSVATCTFSSAQDWTANGVRILTIHYYGDATNMELPAFVTIGDGTNDASVFVDVNTLAESWGEINVSLPAIELLGVDLSNVTYMEIGFGDGTDQGMGFNQKNTIYVDDIVLYPPTCVLSESSLQADITGDCIVNYNDLDAFALNWLLAGYTVTAAPVSNDGKVLHYNFENNTTDSVAGNNGTLQNLGSAATYDAGHGGGKCIHFNATSGTSGSNMSVPPAAFADVNEEVTFSFWLKNDTAAPAWYMNVFGGQDIAGGRNHLFMLYSPAEQSNMVSVFHAGSSGNEAWSQWDAVTFTQPATFDYTAWNHFALVKNCVSGEMWYYTNGDLMSYARGQVNKMYGCDEFKLGSLYGDSAFFTGCVDDFRVYNRALSHAEVLTLAGQASATVTLNELGAAKADFNDDDAIDFKDYSILASEWLVEDFWP